MEAALRRELGLEAMEKRPGLLNHLNIFGGSYLGQVQSTLGLLLRTL